MNQFKKQFLGLITDFTRATSSRCLRTTTWKKSQDRVPHTFLRCWQFFLGIISRRSGSPGPGNSSPKSCPYRLRSWVSVYTDDDEAYAIWKDRSKSRRRRICRLGDHDNFWPADAKEKGPDGPCRPVGCSLTSAAENGCGKPGCNPGIRAAAGSLRSGTWCSPSSTAKTAASWNLSSEEYRYRHGLGTRHRRAAGVASNCRPTCWCR